MPGGRPSMPVSALKKHLTKEEREHREAAERSLRASVPLEKWPTTKRNSFASKHFDRIKAAFEEIGVQDTMVEAVVNRYCVLLGECNELEQRIPQVKKRIRKLDALWEKKCKAEDVEIKDILDYTKAFGALERQLSGLDVALGAKRNALLQIEKENIMTVLSKLRAVPKKPPEDEPEQDPMEKQLANVESLAARRAMKRV